MDIAEDMKAVKYQEASEQGWNASYRLFQALYGPLRALKVMIESSSEALACLRSGRGGSGRSSRASSGKKEIDVVRKWAQSEVRDEYEGREPSNIYNVIMIDHSYHYISKRYYVLMTSIYIVTMVELSGLGAYGQITEYGGQVASVSA